MKWKAKGHIAEDVCDALFDLVAAPDTVALTDEYFDPHGKIAGAWFDRYEDPHGPNAIGHHDLVAMTMLETRATGLLTRDLLTDESFQAEVTAHLERIPDVDLWSDEAEAALDPADKLWNLIETYTGMTDSVTSKLFARKRPRLIPIMDERIRMSVPVDDRIDYWKIYRSAFTCDGGRLVDQLAVVRDASQYAGHVSLLRLLDAIVWLRGRPSRGAVRLIHDE